ncbi:hypothetical protein [Pseudomonas marginalis]|uniref:hypothetical protein n=1 Tax=Pseudomonas marginalis TaxID=298 RepID=UPI002A3607E1|nr:hypothetical protein [Pseudomonas marginalis]WPN20786.1 hypothetical protein QMK57_15260 [Pseudomonas marginalis]
MNNLSKDAQVRSQLFESLVGRYNATLIPGRYGGDYNNDQLAISEADGNVTLFLGLKLLDSEGALQLDAASLGPHLQYSKPWFSALIASLKCSPDTVQFSVKIESVLAKILLVACVICMDPVTQDIKLLRIAI